MAQFTFDPSSPDECAGAQQVIALYQSTATITTPTAGTTNEPETTATDDTTVDSHGMLWNADIHASTKTQNTDGSWKCRQGKKAELDAAIAAHKAAQTADAGATMTADTGAATTGGMPTPNAGGGMPSPASSAPNTPPAPITYADMSTRFVGKMESGQISDFEAVYRELSIDYNDLETNQSSIQRLSAYMNALDAGQDHATAVATASTVQ